MKFNVYNGRKDRPGKLPEDSLQFFRKHIWESLKANESLHGEVVVHKDLNIKIEDTAIDGVYNLICKRIRPTASKKVVLRWSTRSGQV